MNDSANDATNAIFGGAITTLGWLVGNELTDFLFGGPRGRQPAPHPGVIVDNRWYPNWTAAAAGLNYRGNRLMEPVSAFGHILDIGHAVVWDVPVGIGEGLVIRVNYFCRRTTTIIAGRGPG